MNTRTARRAPAVIWSLVLLVATGALLASRRRTAVSVHRALPEPVPPPAAASFDETAASEPAVESEPAARAERSWSRHSPSRRESARCAAPYALSRAHAGASRERGRIPSGSRGPGRRPAVPLLGPCIVTVLIAGEIRGRIRCGEGAHTIGRAPECELLVVHPTVSRYHAELIVTGRGVSIRDLCSTNGTFVRGAADARVRLGLLDRDTVLLSGSVSLHIKHGAAAETGR